MLPTGIFNGRHAHPFAPHFCEKDRCHLPACTSALPAAGTLPGYFRALPRCARYHTDGAAVACCEESCAFSAGSALPLEEEGRARCGRKEQAHSRNHVNSGNLPRHFSLPAAPAHAFWRCSAAYCCAGFLPLLFALRYSPAPLPASLLPRTAATSRTACTGRKKKKKRRALSQCAVGSKQAWVALPIIHLLPRRGAALRLAAFDAICCLRFHYNLRSIPLPVP